jgi:hypothetical protein
MVPSSSLIDPRFYVFQNVGDLWLFVLMQIRLKLSMGDEISLLFLLFSAFT